MYMDPIWLVHFACKYHIIVGLVFISLGTAECIVCLFDICKLQIFQRIHSFVMGISRIFDFHSKIT